VASVSSGEAAVDWVKESRFDLLVLDMIMDPGIDGLETYRRILRIHPGQRAVITSGFSESDRVHEARKLGADAYVKKPYRLDTIARAIRDVLKR
jgi:DNA-binding NarL/FixJ family response regulator